jgi:NAD(P)H-hydrate repair Nnr-like enzyme with NAD(P)H-hydrate dehydratase domain
LDGFDAARLGVWAHSRSGALWARVHGDRGLLASDLAQGFPEALASAQR